MVQTLTQIGARKNQGAKYALMMRKVHHNIKRFNKTQNPQELLSVSVEVNIYEQINKHVYHENKGLGAKRKPQR